MINRNALIKIGTIALLILGGVVAFTSVDASQANSKGLRLLKGDEQVQNAVPENEEATDTMLPSLQSRARLSLNDTIRIAEGQGQGKPYKAELEGANNALIYSVSSSSGETLIDAGNGKVLTLESKDGKETDNNWKGSLKVSEKAEGDGDGETEDDG
jgi:uncharacterized membrane protein YkoI